MHERISVNSICFMASSLEQQAANWRELQPRRVSLLGAHIAAAGLAAVQGALGGGDYRLETIVHPFLPGQPLDPDKATWAAARTSLDAQIDTAAALGAASIYMVTGGHGSLTWEQAAETFCAMVAPCRDRARDKGIALMIENAPALYADVHIAHTLRDTIRLAEMADIGVCIDLPGCWTESDLQASIERAAPRCALVQVSDYVLGDRALPCRAVPGDGDMPLERLFGWILGAGYTGAFDLELLGPRIDAEGAVAACGRAARAVGDILGRLGA